MASVTCGSGWAAKQKPHTAKLSTGERERLARHYERTALMEHASVAAFARFSLELLALGAPAELLRDTQQALGDEIRHAEICFGFAREYGGREICPGPLPMDGAVTTPEIRKVFETAFLEACIGETIAAVEVEAALARSSDPSVRAALTQIAADERRHAELGWRFVHWAFGRLPSHVRAELADGMLASALAVMQTELGSEDDAADVSPNEQAHGLLSRHDHREARRAALEHVCLPCVQAFIEATSEQLRAA